MMNCKRATELLSEKLDRPLSTKEKVALGIHTTMCVSCRLFSQQMQGLRDLSKFYVKGNGEETNNDEKK
ncbi:zf-HC2 domain-containing protein [Marinomonas sp. C2222]|uniref:Zf-HC2 domain-containing protein n=1 Tax=Marinomonas sargassi TaxID=2984494 RepID=A0ABT2YPK4_9GAMM|nr:zf-HC2 domain-containing protein [Marinomonas sargassi]MCV2401805.1 zf-HC2 domain-containing protein [Marinomonas sargassi]